MIIYNKINCFCLQTSKSVSENYI